MSDLAYFYPPKPIDITLVQGATFRKVIRWKLTANSTKDLTGYTILFQIRLSTDAATALVSLTNDSGIDVSNLSSGEFTITIEDTETTNLDFDTAVYDVKVSKTGEPTRRLLEGNVFLKKQVSRSD